MTYKPFLVFTLAGAITWGLVRYVMWRHKTTGVPAFVGAVEVIG